MFYCFILSLQGIPEINSMENLVDVLTYFIYTCSVEHSATNFPQCEQYAFPPNFAALLNGQPEDEMVLYCDLILKRNFLNIHILLVTRKTGFTNIIISIYIPNKIKCIYIVLHPMIYIWTSKHLCTYTMFMVCSICFRFYSLFQLPFVSLLHNLKNIIHFFS